MTALASSITGVLTTAALLHLAWAIGYWTPIRDEALLAKAVVGTHGITEMPGPVSCALVALALAFTAVLPHRADFPLHDLLMPAITAVFLLRGLAAYTPAWRRLAPEEPFATLDRRYYAPLCLMLGIGYLGLQLGGF